MKTKSTSSIAPRVQSLRLHFSAFVLTLAALTAWCSSSLATITINTITGVSNYTPLNQTTSAGTPTASATPSSTQAPISVYGGLAGPYTSTACGVSPKGAGLCNNCITAEDGLYDCNESRIFPNLPITITFVSNSTDGTAAVTFINEAGVATPITLSPPLPGSLPKNSVQTVTFTWGAVCQSLQVKSDSSFAGADCTSSGPASGIIRIGVIANGSSSTTLTTSDEQTQVTFWVSDVQADSANSTPQTNNGRTTHFAKNCSDDTAIGISCFSMLPGDGKASVHDVIALNGFPVGSALGFQGAQLFYAPGRFADGVSFSTFSFKNGSSSILPATSSGTTTASLSPADVDGLTNDTLYMFKMGTVDLAGNVSFFTADADNTFCSQSTDPVSTSDGFCHEAKPGVVYGALGKTVNCFIATAAYGSPMAPQVDTFRQFRNRFLLNSAWGKSLVRFYYTHSPKYAKIIAESETLRTVARVSLWPVLAFVTLTLKFGLINSLLMILAAVVIPTSLYVLRLNRGARA